MKTKQVKTEDLTKGMMIECGFERYAAITKIEESTRNFKDGNGTLPVREVYWISFYTGKEVGSTAFLGYLHKIIDDES